MLRFPDAACDTAFGGCGGYVCKPGGSGRDVRLDAAAHAIAVCLARGVHTSGAAALLGRELAVAALAAADATQGAM